MTLATRNATPHDARAARLREASRRLVAVVGASGAGKDALIQAWVASVPLPHRPHVARRVITRDRHPSEDHEPVSDAGFQQLLSAGRLAFHWQAHGLHYGVRWEELAPLAAGRGVIVNGSRHHLASLRALAPHARVVEVMVPEAVRLQRLATRGREDAAAVAARLARPAPQAGADLVIDNSGPLHEGVRLLQRWWNQPPHP